MENKTDMQDIFATMAKASKTWFEELASQQSQQELGGESQKIVDMYKQFFANSQTFLNSQQNFYQKQMNLWQTFFNIEQPQGATSNNPVINDRRFSAAEWNDNPFFACLKKSYLDMSEYLVNFINTSNMDDQNKQKMRFFIRQYLDAIAPTNFALTNPDVIKEVQNTGGASLLEGMKHMLDDMENGGITMTDKSSFAIGTNLAITAGKVIFRNELIELIQYTPTTASTYEIPLLIVPPCINKYYILDLQPTNSMIVYLVSQGYTVYLISWKSADKAISHYSWPEYINIGVIKAIEIVRTVSKKKKINVLGYCIGGIILTCACLILKARKLDFINSITHMTVMLDHTEPGDIKYFLDKDLLKLQHAQKNNGGIMSGKIIAQTFSALRPNELIWNYWVNNYLLGKIPPSFDILFWNNDSVDLPALMHGFLLSKFYVENNLVNNNLEIDGVKLDLQQLNYPTYLFAAQKDHIVPWQSAYKTTKYINGKIRFVLGASGHTAGVVNPVSSDKRNYWVNDKINQDPDVWYAQAREMPGSWWKDYSAWLGDLSGKMIVAPRTCGSKEYTPLCDAPGEYVYGCAMPILDAQIS